ncbi:MAG: low molecular weight protein tyrosine phosphatase family protein [Phormidesmis sp.]
MNILFICSRNQWRSPTAESVWRNRSGLSTRSAGTSRNARRKVTAADIRWADTIMVMEHKHKDRLTTEFTRLIKNKTLYVLDIPDEYKFMDPDLVEHFEAAIPALLNL